MPRTAIKSIWNEKKEVIILGGGPSLKDFDFNLLKSHFVIGCNDAYLLGEDICDICVFGDIGWYKAHKDKLKKFKNPIYTNTEDLYLNPPEIPNLNITKRIKNGLGISDLAWNQNTGCMACNLAMILGAAKIYLLGFDMKLSDTKENNWHENPLTSPNMEVYQKFINGFMKLEKARTILFPNVEIVNITNDSALDLFPKIKVSDFWKPKLKKKEVEVKTDDKSK